jgi:hypothetical protein
MDRRAVEEILARAIEDEQFRAQLVHAPAEAVAGYDLTARERQAIIDGDLRRVLLSVGTDV